MTTSTREHVVEEWDRDTIGDTERIDGRPRYTIHDMSFENAWLRSDISYRLDKMR